MWRDSAFRAVRRAKRHLADSTTLRRLPLVKYTYALDVPQAIVVDALDCVYVPIPKVANRSMKAAIMTVTHPGYTGDPHRAGWRTVRAHSLHRERRFRFAFVRNPLDRLFSLYSQKIVYYARELGKPNLFWRYGDVFSADMGFEAFVEAVVAIPDPIADRHFRSQHVSLYHRDRLLVDTVGRFETLTEDWDRLRASVDPRLPALPHYNPSRHAAYQTAYTRRTATLAADRYARDLRCFGYADAIDRVIDALA